MKGQLRISVKQVVSSVIRNLGIQDAAMRFHDFVEWAFEAERKIGSYVTFDKKIAKLAFKDKRALLPDDFINMIQVKGLDGVNTYSSGGYINADISDKELDLEYEAISVDDEGYPTIASSHEDAVSHYLMYKYKAKDYYNGKIPRYIYKDMKNEWGRLCGQARGNDNMPTKQQWNSISKYWNTLTPTKNQRNLF